MATIGFVLHPRRESAALLAKETSEWLENAGHSVALLAPGEELPQPLDLAVSLGGDGTMLLAVELVSSAGAPVLGVNLGRLGYLTAVEPSGLKWALERFLNGDFQVEARMRLDVSIERPDGCQPLVATALNDVVVVRTTVGHTMHAAVAVNSTPFLTIASDSLILATPTGSTAYNMSARGPIVSPRARVQILTPVAPHMLFDRSLVLEADEVVTITAAGEQPIDVVVDGRPKASMLPGQSLHCHQSPHDALLVTFGERHFRSILKSKFDLTDR